MVFLVNDSQEKKMITSTSSNQVKHVIQLQKKAKVRKEYKEFVVEGSKMVAEAPADRMLPRHLQI